MPSRRIKIVVEFDGRPFTGWQRQRNGISVQEVLEIGLENVLQHRVTLFGAGRTDAGVHALAMPAHFDTSNPIPAERLSQALQPFLPREVAVVAATETSPEFDSRGDALLRWYRYQIQTGRSRHPLGARVWRVVQPLDRARIKKALAQLEGKHDFRGFRAATCTAKRTLLTMREASLRESGDLLAFDFKCQSFLQRMVRLMAGAIVGVGEGRLSLAALVEIRDSGRRPSVVRSAPAEGLCLMDVAYTLEDARRLLDFHPLPPSF